MYTIMRFPKRLPMQGGCLPLLNPIRQEALPGAGEESAHYCLRVGRSECSVQLALSFVFLTCGTRLETAIDYA